MRQSVTTLGIELQLQLKTIIFQQKNMDLLQNREFQKRDRIYA